MPISSNEAKQNRWQWFLEAFSAGDGMSHWTLFHWTLFLCFWWLHLGSPMDRRWNGSLYAFLFSFAFGGWISFPMVMVHWSRHRSWQWLIGGFSFVFGELDTRLMADVLFGRFGTRCVFASVWEEMLFCVGFLGVFIGEWSWMMDEICFLLFFGLLCWYLVAISSSQRSLSNLKWANG